MSNFLNLKFSYISVKANFSAKPFSLLKSGAQVGLIHEKKIAKKYYDTAT